MLDCVRRNVIDVLRESSKLCGKGAAINKQEEVQSSDLEEAMQATHLVMIISW
jgi:hypothetical protein